MTFTDPVPAQFTGDSLLERVSRAHEEAIDAYGDAVDQAAIAENNYLRLHSIAWVHAIEDGIAATVRDKHCNAQTDVCEAPPGMEPCGRRREADTGEGEGTRDSSDRGDGSSAFRAGGDVTPDIWVQLTNYIRTLGHWPIRGNTSERGQS